MPAGSFFKTLSANDRTTTRTLLHENIPITEAIIDGTYSTTSGADGVTRENNVKAFTHGMFVSVYDYPHASSSANHVFDMSIGVDGTNSNLIFTEQETKKKNIYNQMAQILVGYDLTGSIRAFDANGNFAESGDAKHKEVVFLNFSRLLVKDEIKKGTFSMVLHADTAHGDFSTSASTATITIDDVGAATSYLVNSPAGEYGILKATNTTGAALASSPKAEVGLIFYQAGIVVLNLGIFAQDEGAGAGLDQGFLTTEAEMDSSTNDIETLLEGSTISVITDAIRNRMKSISFNNTTELNSTIYFCRANHNEFNYSANPTYLDNSKIRVKNNEITTPTRSYVTTVGLYSADNELMAVAKLSEPLRKDPSNELTLRVRLDY